MQTYGFDAMGNRTAKTDNVSGSETYGFNAANMLTNRSASGTASTYSNDANGNTLSGGGRVSTWDSQNRLVKVVKSGVTSEFTYGCDGLRRRSVVTNTAGEQTKTDYVLDGQSVVQEIVKHRVNTNASWGVAATVSYLMGPSGPLYRHLSGTTDVSWYVYDGLGSVVGEVDVTGNLTATKKHDVYGLTRSMTGTPTSRHGFVGGLGHVEDDETGYLYMRARHYDPETGRFASQDPALHGGNWFLYCGNDPTNKVDSSGKCYADLLLSAADEGEAQARNAGEMLAAGAFLLGALAIILGGYLLQQSQALDGIVLAKDKRKTKMGTNGPRNDETDRIANDVGLTPGETRRLHDWVTGQNMDLDEIRDFAEWLVRNRRNGQ